MKMPTWVVPQTKTGYGPMIDLHAHILPGLDDGARTIADSLKMCQIAYRDGIKTVVATPHTLNGLYQNDRSTILTKVRELNAVIDKRSSVTDSRDPSTAPSEGSQTADNKLPVTNNGLPITNNGFLILPGADVHFSDQTLGLLTGGEVMTIGDGGKCVLLEFPFQGIPYGAEEVLFQMVAKGIIPIISHPERNLEVGQRFQRYYELIRMGCVGQVTAMSLTGGFGSGVRRVAEKLLTKRLVHLIASDAHSADGRPPVLSPAVRAAARIVGQEEAQRMVTEHPQAILQGHRPDIPAPIGCRY